MHLEKPRITPLEASEWTAEQREVIEKAKIGDQPYNVFKTLVRHPDLLRRWIVFAAHVLGKSTLSPRQREIVILRIGWLCKSEYEWAQHVVIGRERGLDDDDIERIMEGPQASGWVEAERALMAATDDLHRDAFISEETWQALARHFDEKQIMDVIFAVGNYNLVSMALNSLGVQLDEGLVGFTRTP